jgi:hypothetical protein
METTAQGKRQCDPPIHVPVGKEKTASPEVVYAAIEGRCTDSGNSFLFQLNTRGNHW